MSNLPEPWATRLVAKGFTDRRSTKSATPSVGALAEKVGVNTSTITDAILGKRKPSRETVRMLVRELGEDVETWLGVESHGPYEPPAEADLLTPRQRDAVSELIRSIVAADQGGAEDVQRPAAIATPRRAKQRERQFPKMQDKAALDRDDEDD